MARDPYPTAALLNRRVDVWGPTEVVNELDQTSIEYAYIRTVWARIRPKSGSFSYQQTETILTNVTHDVTIRYKAAQGIDVGHFFKYDGRRFDIRYPMNINEANWMVMFDCQEVKDT